MTIQDGLLMRTPAHHPLESPLHYILRLSAANGYVTPVAIMGIAMRDPSAQVQSRWDYTHLNRVLPECRHLPAEFGYQREASLKKCELALLGKPILSRHLRAPQAGICPECLRELGYAPAWWDIRYVIACPKHHRMLVLRCAKCGRKIHHLRRDLLTCSCGSSLDIGCDEEPTDELLWLMGLLQQKAESPLAASTASERPLKPEDVDLNTLCKIIETTAKAESHIQRHDAATPSPEELRECLPHVAAFLCNWPNGVRAFCSRWRESMKSMKAKRLGFRARFSWAFESLFKNLRERRSETLFVADAVLRDEVACRGGCAMDIRCDDLKGIARGDGPYCTVARASALSGIPLHTFIRLVRKGAVPYRVRYRGNQRCYEIETEIARTLTIENHPAMLHRQASQYVGVTHELYRDLRHAGILGKTHATKIPTAIAIVDLQAFKMDVLSRAQPHPTANDLTSLDDLRRNRCPRSIVVRLITEILDGSIPCYRAQPPSSRLDALLVRRKDVPREAL
jgi:hypothetical protein